jgi:hypothetical protein
MRLSSNSAATVRWEDSRNRDKQERHDRRLTMSETLKAGRG